MDNTASIGRTVSPSNSRKHRVRSTAGYSTLSQHSLTSLARLASLVVNPYPHCGRSQLHAVLEPRDCTTGRICSYRPLRRPLEHSYHSRQPCICDQDQPYLAEPLPTVFAQISTALLGFPSIETHALTVACMTLHKIHAWDAGLCFSSHSCLQPKRAQFEASTCVRGSVIGPVAAENILSMSTRSHAYLSRVGSSVFTKDEFPTNPSFDRIADLRCSERINPVEPSRAETIPFLR